MKVGHAIREPKQWDDDGGVRVEVVTDPNWLINGQPRVVRRVGWRPCMCCKRGHFSQDIARIRLCEACKAIKTDKSHFGSSFIAPKYTEVTKGPYVK
jgi:hypothetical protein